MKNMFFMSGNLKDGHFYRWPYLTKLTLVFSILNKKLVGRAKDWPLFG